MEQYRITKYNPHDRNASGAYLIDEWTSFYDVGKEYGGKVFTISDYIKTEDDYIRAVINFMEFASTAAFKIVDLEIHDADFDVSYTMSMRQVYSRIKEGMLVGGSEIADVCRLILREDIWGKLVSEKMFVHFGYDYYMYIGVEGDCRKAIEETEKSGLYVEKFQSPVT